MQVPCFSLLLVSALLLWCPVNNSAFPDAKLYIVYMGVRNPELNVHLVTSLHHEILSGLLGSEVEAKAAMVYSYRENFSGFAAILTPREADAVSRLPGVISVFPSRTRKLHTTRSWEFLGVASHKDSLSFGGDVVIGVFDTGVWPESHSFSDHSLGPVPSRWRGVCEPTFACNRKLIGARSYSKGFEREFGRVHGEKSPRDTHGHGTHTASIAAGSPVSGANFFGLARGLARGGAPAARLAVYKVCWGRECSDADVLAAFDDALSDGVDVLSISLGEEPLDYFEDAVAVGGFHAMQRNILTVVSAGNEGPDLHAAKNVAPWLLTVAASSIDRKFVTQMRLGNNSTFKGAAINGFTPSDKWSQLIFAGSLGNVSQTMFCGKNMPDPKKLRNKIVVCYAGDNRPDESVLLAGGAGLVYVIAEGFDSKEAFSFAVPANALNNRDGERVLSYINSTRHPFGRFFPTIVQTGKRIKSTVALFSSRGPNQITPDILKPDVIAPGVDILGAWSPRGPVSGLRVDHRSSSFNVLSGTSMSCPHVSGAAAVLRSIHPDWSPAAIKSALMTTATQLDRSHRFNRHGALAFGSGQINPVAAMDPGLVYDLIPQDYALFLCSIGYNSTQLHLMLDDRSFRCSPNSKHGRHRQRRVSSVNDLNYPSVALGNLESRNLNATIRRILTNVGPPNSTYHSQLEAPPHVRVRMLPEVVHFTSRGQTRSFTVKLESEKLPRGKFLEGWFAWTDGKRYVRSPIILWRKETKKRVI